MIRRRVCHDLIPLGKPQANGILEHGPVWSRSHAFAMDDPDTAEVASDAFDEELVQGLLRSQPAHAVEIDLGFDAVQSALQPVQDTWRDARARKLDFGVGTCMPSPLEAVSQHGRICWFDRTAFDGKWKVKLRATYPDPVEAA